MNKKAVQAIMANLPELKTVLDDTFDRFQSEDGRYILDEEFFKQMKSFAKSGKLFRGCLLLSVYSALTNSKDITGAVKIAAGLELYCSGLLVQDDIMDRDAMRRGGVTSHIQLQGWAAERKIAQPAHFGRSIAMCFGDILYFLATRLLAEAEIPYDSKLQALAISSRELALLGLAQSEDMRMAGTSIENVSKEEIIAMQYGKTGRYTGRWPLAVAGTLAKMSEENVEKLARVGDEIGLLYQFRDDYLGIFGDSEKTGKNTASDIREGKKTLYYFEAFTTILGKDASVVQSVFGNHTATEEQVETLKSLLREHEVVQRVDQEIITHTKLVKKMIAELSVTESVKKLLLVVVDLVVTREK